MSQLIQRAASDWLLLRQNADNLAREAAAPLLAALTEHLNTSAEVMVLDLGAGSGSNLSWLASRLSVPQTWTLIDLDSDLLQLVPKTNLPSQVRSVRTQQRSIDDLSVQELEAAGLVTASAVLDILSFTQLDRLASLLDGAQVPAFFSLNVTGNVHLMPPLPADGVIADAFNSHQLRAGLAGPRAVPHLEEHLRRAGFRVMTTATPWLLGAHPQIHRGSRNDNEELIERYLAERVAAAVEQQPHLARRSGTWLTTRLTQLHRNALSVQVDHVDLLALPPA